MYAQARSGKITDFDPGKSIDDKTQPCNIEAEMAILGGVLFDPSAIGRIADIITADVFYIEAHKSIWRAVADIYESGKTPDPIEVASWLRSRSLLSAVGGQSKLATLMDLTVSATNIDQYAALVLDKYFRRQLSRCAEELKTSAFQEWRPIREVLDAHNSKLEKLVGGQSEGFGMKASDLVSHLWKLIEGDGSNIFPTGLYDLDEAFSGGFYPGQLVVFAGETGMGKTEAAVDLSYRIAQSGAAVVFFSIEMSKESLGARFLSRACKQFCDENGSPSDGLSYDCLFRAIAQKGSMADWSQDCVMAFAGGSALKGDLPLYVEENTDPDEIYIRNTLRRVRAEMNGKDIGLVVLDHLHHLPLKTRDPVREYGELCKTFKRIAKEENVPFLLLSQLSRAVSGRNDKRPCRSDLRSSGEIEQIADRVVFIYRDEVHNPDTPDRGIAEYIVSKNRMGRSGITIKVLHEAGYAMMKNLAKPSHLY